MTTKEQEINKYLVKIADNLNISDTMRDKVIASYKAVGEWLGDCDENSNVRIMPQGSFNLGTVIKPLSDNEDYDIDLICLLKDKSKANAYDIKNIVGNRLKEHKVYRENLRKEGKRCWTLNYDEFHMDILPSVPNNIVYQEPDNTELRITNKIADKIYESVYSNPYKYRVWFEERMQIILIDLRKEFAERNQVEISKVPLYKVKTPLQQAIQLLKRHRDIMYSSNNDNAPISIIITTLAAHAYNNEPTVFEALKGILNGMQNYITVKNNEYWVVNPVMSQENFAEKWNKEPIKKTEFDRWMKKAKQEILVDPVSVYGLQNISEKMQVCFGDNIVVKSFKELGQDTRAARENKSLYVQGLTGGLTTNATATSRKVEDHTFFGK